MNLPLILLLQHVLLLSIIKLVWCSKVAIVLIEGDILEGRPPDRFSSPSFLKEVKECWNSNCTHLNHEMRWAMGHTLWDEIITKQTNGVDEFDVYFIKYNESMSVGSVIVQPSETKRATLIEVGRQSHRKTNIGVNIILYKTMIAFKYLSSLQKYDFVVRGNANVIVDLCKFSQYLKQASTTRLCTSPVFESAYYMYGYFMLFSADVMEGMIKEFAAGTIERHMEFVAKKYNRTIRVDSDDSYLSLLATGHTWQGEQFSTSYCSLSNIVPGGDPPNHLGRTASFKNRFALRIVHEDKPWSTEQALYALKHRDPDTFLLRIQPAKGRFNIIVIWKELLGSFRPCATIGGQNNGAMKIHSKNENKKETKRNAK